MNYVVKRVVLDVGIMSVGRVLGKSYGMGKPITKCPLCRKSWFSTQRVAPQHYVDASSDVSGWGPPSLAQAEGVGGGLTGWFSFFSAFLTAKEYYFLKPILYVMKILHNIYIYRDNHHLPEKGWFQACFMCCTVTSRTILFDNVEKEYE